MGAAAAPIALGAGSLISSRSASRSQDRATTAQLAANREAMEYQRQATERATSQAIPLFEQAQQNSLQGYGAGIDLLRGMMPAQMNLFQQGNVGAQNIASQAMQQQNAAILGGNIDYSAFQPQTLALPDLGFIPQMPEYGTIADALPQATVTRRPTDEQMMPYGRGGGAVARFLENRRMRMV